jgi:ankyrin repeat protein
MLTPQQKTLLTELVDGRTELIFDLVAVDSPGKLKADFKDDSGVSLLRHCAYYGDVSAIRFLLTQGESLQSLGKNLDLMSACFHGHWRLCKFLIENGADPNLPSPESLETPLHAALCTSDRTAHDLVLKVLLTHGADPNVATTPGIETEGFMRDCRTKGETPLHRAAAFGSEDTIQLLLNAGDLTDARDATGDTPLSWASWYLRPTPILRQLCYGDFRINPHNRSMRANLLGQPNTSL